jgi:hypothetical protein
MGVLDGLTLKCGTTQYNDVATLANAEKAEKGHPNYQELLTQPDQITLPNMSSRFEALKAFIEKQKAKVLELVHNIREWYGRFIPSVGTNLFGGGDPPTTNDVNDDNVVKRCRELSYDVLNLAILHDTQYLEEAAELIDDVFKAQYFDDTEKKTIINALNTSTEMNNMCNLVTCFNSILNKWYAPRKKREGEEEGKGEQNHANDPLNATPVLKKARLFQPTPPPPPSLMFPEILSPSQSPSQNSNNTQQPLSPPQSPPHSQTSAGTQSPPQSPPHSQTSAGTQWPPYGGSPKTFKYSFFKDSAMPNWHSSASPFNQYATMKRLYRKNFKRFLLKYTMQGERILFL